MAAHKIIQNTIRAKKLFLISLRIFDMDSLMFLDNEDALLIGLIFLRIIISKIRITEQLFHEHFCVKMIRNQHA